MTEAMGWILVGIIYLIAIVIGYKARKADEKGKTREEIKKKHKENLGTYYVMRSFWK